MSTKPAYWPAGYWPTWSAITSGTATNAIDTAMLQAFDHLRRIRGRPFVYAIPWQTPSGLTYNNDVDAWVDGTGAVVTKTPSQLTYYEIPALWGADADTLGLISGGLMTQGELAVVARTSYHSQLNGAMMVVTGSLSGDKYHLVELENAPDGGTAVFVVARLQRRER